MPVHEHDTQCLHGRRCCWRPRQCWRSRQRQRWRRRRRQRWDGDGNGRCVGDGHGHGAGHGHGHGYGNDGHGCDGDGGGDADGDVDGDGRRPAAAATSPTAAATAIAPAAASATVTATRGGGAAGAGGSDGDGDGGGGTAGNGDCDNLGYRRRRCLVALENVPPCADISCSRVAQGCSIRVIACNRASASLRTMAPKGKAAGKARSWPRTGQRRVRKLQVAKANARQSKRRQAIASLNTLATTVGYGVEPLAFKTAGHEDVEKRVRALQRRCLSDELHEELLAASKLYTENGGRFSVPINDPMQDHVREVPLVAKHRVLVGDFRLASQAFMLTYHSQAFTEDTWPLFLAFVKGRLPRLGCRAWSACMEKGTEARTVDKYHFHAYFYWNDGIGLDIPSTDILAFQTVRPRVDKRTAKGSSAHSRH